MFFWFSKNPFFEIWKKVISCAMAKSALCYPPPSAKATYISLSLSLSLSLYIYIYIWYSWELPVGENPDPEIILKGGNLDPDFIHCGGFLDYLYTFLVIDFVQKPSKMDHLWIQILSILEKSSSIMAAS